MELVEGYSEYIEIENLNKFLSDIDNLELSELFHSDFFLFNYCKHIKHDKLLDVKSLYNECEKWGFPYYDLNRLCAFSNFINKNKNDYIQINNTIIPNAFSINISTNLMKSEIVNQIVISSTIVNLDVLFNSVFNQYKVEKLSDCHYHIVSKDNDFHLISFNIKDYLFSEYNELKIDVEDEVLEDIINFYKYLLDNCLSYIEIRFIVNSVKLLIESVDCLMQKIKIRNLIQNKSAINYFDNLGCRELKDLLNIDWVNVDSIAEFQLLGELIFKQNFISPTKYRKKLFSNLNELETNIVKLKYYDSCKNSDICNTLNINNNYLRYLIHKINRYFKDDEIYDEIIYKMYLQLLLFRDNDYYVTNKLFDDFNIPISLCKTINYYIEFLDWYKSIKIFPIRVLTHNDLFWSNDLSLNIREFEDEYLNPYTFLYNAPQFLYKNKLESFYDIILENATAYIEKSQIEYLVTKIYEYDYKILISKNKLDLDTFLIFLMFKYKTKIVGRYGNFDISSVAILLFEIFGIDIANMKESYILNKLKKIRFYIKKGVWIYHDDDIKINENLVNLIDDYIFEFPKSTIQLELIYKALKEKLLKFGIYNEYDLKCIIKDYNNPKYYIDNLEVYKY